jgi:hypothetical protein
VTAVLRWDVITNIALKAQITREPESGPDWVTADPSSNKRVNIYGIGADFIF